MTRKPLEDGAAMIRAALRSRPRPAALPPAGPESRTPPAPRRTPLRVLVMSHMDPRVSRGGAEIAAFQLYEYLKAQSNVTAWFLAAAPGKIGERLGVRLIQPFGPDDYAYVGHGFDHFIHSNSDPEFPPEFITLLRDLQPDVVHLHHYTNFGMEALLQIRRALPDVRIVLTLHEYLAICNHFGQMVKRPSFSLCDRSSPRDCHKCFPEISEQDFFLRELFMKRFFRLVDHFVSPSHFLIDRYVRWGLPAAKLSMIENGMPIRPQEDRPNRYPDLKDGLVVGFFGQISGLKGINVLIEAAEMLHEQGVTNVRIDVHGDHSGQPEPFRKEFEARLAKAPPNFSFRGPYENRRVDALMRSVHAVLVPSIWWENSPLVIQEALLNRRPVICSDIGGMAEKVRYGLDGFHFQAGSAFSLANLLRNLAAEPQRLLALQDTMAVPPTIAETGAAMLDLYDATLRRTAKEQAA
ncbi:glycosyltransferase [Paracraurococcus lichenis]|uniref:Glycosyltransferase n=1 Tax=Paracraurococcus lichenis TaxID=3064888 RepID=A0ABT9DWM1_9PROT|nr:glycosyltransferase [Paracraurococcus sp. LOR1-02]MDO9708297.1 glycosyltransferase [Paracraurococcus sp. LOR1-02]